MALDKKALRRATPIVAVSLLISGSVTQFATAAEPAPGTPVDETYVDGQGVVHYNFDPSELPGFTVEQVAGTPLPTTLVEDPWNPHPPENVAGCEFNQERPGPADNTAEASIELTYDPTTCTLKVARAIYPADAVPEVVDTGGVPAAGDLTDEESGPDVAPLAAARWFAAVNTWYMDPPALKVNSTYAEVRWNTTQRNSWYHRWSWMDPGWSRISKGSSHAGFTTTTWGSFKNTWFCNPSKATYTSLRASVTGRTNGTWTYAASGSKSGDCASLLRRGTFAKKAAL